MRILLSLIFILYSFVNSIYAESVYNTDYQTVLSKGNQDTTIVTQGKTTILTIYKDNKIMEVIRLVDDKKNGLQEQYNYAGNLKKQSDYKNGFLDGTTIIYDNRSTIKEIINYKYNKTKGHSLLQGKYEKFNNGKLLISANYKDSLLHGKRTEYFNGVLRSVAYYKYGLLSGKSKKYNYRNGQLISEQNYKIIKEDGKNKSVLNGKEIYYFNGLFINYVGKYKNGLKEGKWKKYYRNTKKLDNVINYKKGLQYGKFTYYYASGTIKKEGKAYEERNPKGAVVNKFDGEFKEYYSTGVLLKILHFDKGEKTGLFEEYYNNGKIKQQGFYSNSLKTSKWLYLGIAGDTVVENNYKIISKNDKQSSVKHGLLKRWKNKNLVLKENWFEGVKHGKSLSYYRNGNVSTEMNFDKGLLFGKYVNYYENGKIKSDQTYGIHKVGTSDKLKSDLVGWSYGYLEDGSISKKMYYDNKGVNTFLSLYNKNGFSDIYYGNMLSVRFFPNGGIMSIVFNSSNSQPCFAQYYYMNGQTRIIKFQNIETKSINQLIYTNKGKLLTTTNYTNINIDSLLPSTEIIKSYTEAVGLKFINNPFFTDSIRNGVYELHYGNGNIMCRISTKNELLDGEFVLFDAINGDTLKYYNYKEGNAYGSFIEKFAGKNILKKGELFANGNKKRLEVYSNNGLPYRKEVFDAQGKRIEQKEYFPDGKIRLISNVNTGAYQSFDSKGNPLNITEVEGKYSIVSKYYPLTRKLYTKSFYIDNKKDSIWSSYYASGQLRYKIQYKNDKKDGLYISYDKSGYLRWKGVYKNDMREGAWLSYTDDAVDTINYKHDRVLVKIPKSECACIDTTSFKIGFVPTLNRLIDYQTLIDNLPAYIQSLDSNIYKHLFYSGFYSSSGSYSLNLIMFDKLSVEIPADKQLRLTFNPCHTKGFKSKMRVSTTIDRNTDKLYSASISPKRISLEFIKGPLKSDDKEHKYFTALFDINEIDIYQGRKPNIRLAKGVNSCYSKIIIRDFLRMEINQAQPVIFDNAYINSDIVSDKELENFFGLKVESANLDFNYFKNNINYNINAETKMILAGGNFVAGSILVYCKKIGIDKFEVETTKGKLVFSSQELKVDWLKRGFSHLNMYYEKDALKINFYTK